jgi:peptide deformylase
MIITDEKKLREKCEDVLPEEVDFLRNKLEKELRLSAKKGHPGIGLAAPQIGIYKKIAIVRINGGPNIDLVNCKIDKKYDKFIFENEGCLSFPDTFVNSERYKQISVVNNLIKPYNFFVTGLAAVVVAHEIDHWFGRLLPDFSQSNSYFSK